MRNVMNLLLASFISLFFVQSNVHASILVKDEAVSSPSYSITIPEGEIKSFFKWHPNRVPLISAHRGGPLPGYPENALESFKNATKYGPMIVEIDMAMTSDGVIVLMHDDTVDRTTTCKGLVSAISYNDLLKCKLVDNDGKITSFKVPTLKDTLSWAVGKVVLNLDFKKGVPYSKVLEAVMQAGAQDSVMLLAYTLKQELAMHAAAPDLMLSAPIYNEKMLAEIKSTSIPLDQVVAWVGTRLGTKDFYDILHAHGLYIILGTLGPMERSIDGDIARSGDESEYRRLFELGADIIATDRVDAAASVLLNPYIFYFIPSHLSKP